MRWLIDEMLPSATAAELCSLGHDAISVIDVGLMATADRVVYQAAVDQQRVIVTENFADFARLGEERLASEEPCVPIVFVRKRDFPRGGALGRQLAHHLARHLDHWATANPDPYPGPHWGEPTTR